MDLNFPPTTNHQPPTAIAEQWHPSTLVITIDGPAASGKSSVARAVAKKLGFEFKLDSYAYTEVDSKKIIQDGPVDLSVSYNDKENKKHEDRLIRVFFSSISKDGKSFSFMSKSLVGSDIDGPAETTSGLKEVDYTTYTYSKGHCEVSIKYTDGDKYTTHFDF